MTSLQEVLKRKKGSTPDQASGASAQPVSRFKRMLQARSEDMDVNGVRQFMHAAAEYQTKQNQVYQNMSWQNAGDTSLWDNEEGKSLTATAKKVRTWAWANKDQLQRETFENIVNYVDDFLSYQTGSAKDFRTKAEGMRQYETQEDYDRAVQEYEANREYYDKYTGMSASKLQAAAAALPEGEERSWVMDYASGVQKTKEELQQDLLWLEGQKQHLNRMQQISSQIGAAKSELDATSPDSPRYAERKKRYEDLLRQYPSMSMFEDLESQLSQTETDIASTEKALQYGYLSSNLDYAEKSQNAGGWIGEQVNYLYHPDTEASFEYFAKKYFDTNEKYDASSTHLELMKESERKDFNYIYNTQGEKAAREYLDWLSPTLNKRNQENVAAWVSERTKDIPVLSQVYTSLLSTPIKLIGGAATAYDVLMQKADNVMTGSDTPVDYNRNAMTLTTAGNTIRSSVSQQLVNKSGVIEMDPEEHPYLSAMLNGKSWADVYNLGMSMQDSAVVAAATAVNPALGKVASALLATSAGTDTMLEAASNGASDNQAIAVGIAAGFFEYFFEKYEISSLMKQGGNFGKALVKQGITEAVGEGATELCNMVVNSFVMAENSDWEKSVSAYMEQHPDWSLEQAQKQAFLDAVGQVLQASAGGFLSGGIMGGGAAVVNTGVSNYQHTTDLRNAAVDRFYADKYRADPQGLVNMALEIDPQNQAALAAQEKLANGEALSDQELRQLSEPMAAAEMEKTASARLQELGETGDVAAISKAAVKSAMGQKLTADEKAALKGSQHGSEVVKELSKSYKQEQAEIKSFVKDTIKGVKNTEKAFRKAWKNAEKSQGDVTEVEEDTDIDDLPTETPYEASTEGVTIQNSTGKPVKIQSVAFSNGKLTFQTEGGSQVAASDVTYGTEAEALVYEAVAMLDGIIDGKTATKLSKNLIRQINEGEAVSDYYVRAVAEAYLMGYTGEGIEAARSETSLTSQLTDKQRNYVYNMGAKYSSEVKAVKSGTKVSDSGTKSTKSETKAGNTGTKTDRSGTKDHKKGTSRKNGSVFDGYDGKMLSTSKLKPQQRVGVSFAQRMSKRFGMNFYFYRSYMKDGVRVYKDRNGKIVKAENGFYDPYDRSIHIDLNAGSFGRGTVLFTVSHEFVHFMRDTSEHEFDKLAKLVLNQYRKQGQSLDELIALQQADAEENGRRLTYNEAYEEVIADSMESILADGKVMKLIRKLEAEDLTLAGKVKQFFRNIAEVLQETILGYQKAYSHIAPDSREGNMVREMQEIYDQLQESFAEGIYKGGKNHQALGENKNTTGEGGVRYSQSKNTHEVAYSHWDVEAALWNAMDHSDKGRDNLIRVGNMPGIVVDMLGIKGDFYIYRNHAYENMVSEDQAKQDGRYSAKSHYHNIGFDKMVEAIMMLEDPVLTIASKTKDGNPSVMMVLPVMGNNNAPLYAVLSFYTSKDINGVYNQKPHIVLSIAEREYRENGGRVGLLDIVENAVRNGKVISFDKEKRNYLSVKTKATSLGIITEQFLKDNLAHFRKEIKAFKEKNKINYSTRKGETTSYTANSLLMNADDSIAETPAQKDFLKRYRDTDAQVQKVREELRELQEKLEPIADSKKPKDLQMKAAIRKRMVAAENRLGILQKKLERKESFDIAKEMVAKERKRVVQEQLAAYREEYGTIKAGEKKVRDDSLPVSTDDKHKVSRTARTVKGAEATTDELAELIDEQVASGKLAYLPITNDATTRAAQERMKRDGWNETLEDWKRKVINGHVSADLTATGALLLKEAAESGNKEVWLDILYCYQCMGTSAGQAIQAMRILKQLNPEDRLGMMKRSIAQLVKDTNIKFSADDIVSKIDPDMIEMYKQAETYEEEDWALKEIGTAIAKYVPSTFMDKWTALRYLNMLGNPRTQIRNIAGNIAMGAVSTVKDMTAIGIEQLAYMVSGGKFQRTKALASPAMIKAGGEDFKMVKSMMLGGGKYSDSSWATSQLADAIRENQQIFKNRLLEKYRVTTNWLMEQGDLIFSKAAYAKALAGYLRANGVQSNDFSSVDAELMEKARIYAVNEAQEATFRDTNALSQWISKAGRRSSTHWIGKLISEGSVPFRKTPANILIRAEEYSPLGFVNTVGKMVRKAASTTKLTEKGNVIGAFARGGEMITGADIVNSLSKGLTGTGLFFLGMWLKSIGVLVGGEDDDQDLDQFQALSGQQNYALKFGDTYITIDFLSPAAIPMFVGAEIQKLSEDGGIELKDWEKALSSIADPLVEMSMLQGISDTLDNIRFAEDNILQLFLSTVASYLTQGLTNSWLGQIERGLEKSRQTTYVDSNSALPSWMQRTIGKASAKTPFWDYNQKPYINAWGEEEENPSAPANLAYNMLSPSYISNETTDDVTEELTRLNEVQDDVNVFPSTPSKKYKNEPLSAEEWEALARKQGKTQRQLVEELVVSETYVAMPDIYKAKAISLVYTYAKENAQIEVLGRDTYSSKWMSELEGDIVQGILDHVAADSSTIRKYLRESDPRIREAAQALHNSDKNAWRRIMTEIAQEGKFKRKDIKAAIEDLAEEMEEE